MASAKSRYTDRPESPDAAALVAHRLGRTRRHVARHEVAEGRVAALEVVVALGIRNLRGRTLVALVLRNPHAAVVAQALGHQRQLRLVVAAHRDARRVDLREAGVGEVRAALVRAPRGRHVRVDGVGREVEHRAVAARAEQHGLALVRLELAGDQVAGDDAARLAVDDDQVEHLAAREERRRCPRRPAASSTGRRRAAAAGPSGRARRTCATPARRRTNGCRGGRRIRARTARPARRTGR